jgi:hypothetical protein
MVMKRNPLSFFGLFALFVLLFPFLAHAGNPPNFRCPGFLPGCKTGFHFQWGNDYTESVLLTDIIPNILTWLMWLTAAVAILMGVVSGVMYLYAGVSDELRSRATRTFIYSGVGLLVCMFAYFIVELVNRFQYS